MSLWFVYEATHPHNFFSCLTLNLADCEVLDSRNNYDFKNHWSSNYYKSNYYYYTIILRNISMCVIEFFFLINILAVEPYY